MPRDGARVRRCSRKASAKRNTIKCVRHPGRTRVATNWNHNCREGDLISAQSLFLAPSPVGRITSPMPGRRPTRREPPNTKRVLTKVSRTMCSRASPPSYLRMRMSRESRTPSSKWSRPPLASDRSVFTMTRHRMAPRSSMRFQIVSAPSFFVASASLTC